MKQSLPSPRHDVVEQGFAFRPSKRPLPFHLKQRCALAFLAQSGGEVGRAGPEAFATQGEEMVAAGVGEEFAVSEQVVGVQEDLGFDVEHGDAFFRLDVVGGGDQVAFYDEGSGALGDEGGEDGDRVDSCGVLLRSGGFAVGAGLGVI